MSVKPVAQQVVPGSAGAESSTAARGAARPRESWFHLCSTADAIRQASTPDVKRSLLEPYLGALDAHTIGPATRVFAGAIAGHGDTRPLAISRTLTVRVIRDLTRASAEQLLELTMKLGDLGDAAGEVFSGRLPSGLSVEAVEAWLRELAVAETDEARSPLLREMIAKLSGIEAQYVVRITDGGMDVGLDAALVEEALANAFREPLPLIRNAMAIHNDIGVVAELTRRHQLSETR
jgi:DNA ligase 1